MYTVGVIYESGTEGDLQVIDLIRGVLKERKEIILRDRRGEYASIVDVNASDIVVFASDGNEQEGINDKFAEIVRALKGVNLSGRMLGIISFGGEKIVKMVEEAFRDTCITVFKQSLVYDDTKQIGEEMVRDWVIKLLNKYEEFLDGRE